MERRLRGLVAARRALTGALAGALLASCGLEEQTVELKNGADVTRRIATGDCHHYKLELAADEFVRIVADQQGSVDISVALYAPGGDLLVSVDSPTGRQGAETVVAVAEETGAYRLEVQDVEPDPSFGSYRLTIEEIHPATPADRRRAAAELAFSQAEALYLKGKPDDLRTSVELYQRAREEWGALGARDRQAEALLRLGWVHRNLQDNASALTFLEKSREMYRNLGERSGEGVVLNSLGGVWINLWEDREALPFIQQALEIGREIDAKFLTAEALNNLGIAFDHLGRIDEAVDAYTRARELYEELGEIRSLARTQFNLSDLLFRQGKTQDAADNLEAAARTWEGINDLRRAAMALTNLGDVRRRQGRFGHAVRNLEEALALRRQAEDRAGEAVTLNGLATACLLNKNPDRARLLYEEARKIFVGLGEARGQALTLVNLGRLHVETGDPRRALDLHRLAASLLQGAGDLRLEASNLYGTARALHDLSDFEAARRQIEESLIKVETLRSDTRNEGLRIAFFATRQHYYELYIDILMHLRDDETAFAAGESCRSRALLDALGDQAQNVRLADSQLLEAERSVQERLNDLERRRVALRRLPENDEAQIEEVRKQQRAAVLDLEKVRAEHRAALTDTHPVSLSEGQLLLTPGTLLLAYSLGNERSFLWQVTREGATSHILPGRQEIEEAAVEAHRLLISRDADDASSRASLLATLSETLLGPVAKSLDGQRLLIVAEGALYLLPFAALPGPSGMENPPDYLVRRHEIVYLPSVSVLKTIRDRSSNRAKAPKQLALFADPVVAADQITESSTINRKYEERELRRSVEAFGGQPLLPLPYTRVEASDIRKVARGEVMMALGYDATKAKVLAGDLHKYKIIHFATHGLIHREHPELSGLVLSLFNEKGEYQDGYLRLHEIYNLHLPSELVVLSACQTGVGHEVRGEGFLGLTRGFIYAGASRLVASLWNVEDLGTAELMKRFYWNYLEGKAPPSLALAAAQRSMLTREEWQHPYYWAGFVFLGEWYPPDGKPPIGAAEAGGVEVQPRDPDYPGPGKDCEALPEVWMQELCRLLRQLQQS